MAERTGLSKSAIGRLWRRSGLEPQFVDKVVDVAGLYRNPPERAVVLCVDGHSQVQDLDRARPENRCSVPGLMPASGREARRLSVAHGRRTRPVTVRS